jgi:Flp pilus assembly protein CpaB
VRRRRWLARLPVAPVLLVVAGALVVVSLRSAPPDLATDAAAAVVVATVDLDAGTVIDDDDVVVRVIPVGTSRATTTTTTDEVVGRQVTAQILAGEPVVAERLAPSGLLGLAAATPPGWSAFALPVDASLPAVDTGQRVDLYALAPGSGLDAADDRAATVARAAVVVAVDDERLTVAVRPDESAALAGALIGSRVVVAVTGPTARHDDDP